MSTILIAVGVASVGAIVGGIVWLVWFFGSQARDAERKLGEARGEVDALQAIVVEKDREIEALRIALARALDPSPTLDDLDRVSAEKSGGVAAGAASIRVP